MSQPSMAVPSLNPAFEEIPFPIFGFTLLILGQMFNTVMLTTCKLLVTDDNPIHPIQILFVRMAITYICCLLYMLITRSVPYAPFGEPSVRKWLLLRGVVGFFGVFGSYFSLLYLSMSDSVAITFLVPLITGFLAWILLRERYSLVEAMCGLVSLCGVMLIAKPHFLFGSEADKEAGSADDSVESSSTEKRLLATGVALLGALAAASVFIILRKIGNSAHPLISVSFFSMVTVVISSISIIVIPSISFAIPQDSYQWSLFFTIGIAGFLYQFALTAGVQRVKASKASLVVYLQMVFAIALDVIIWHHFPGFLSILGILVIVGCTLVVMKYKSKPAAGDLERGTHQPLSQDDDGYKPEDIQLQDFVIDDEDDENENTSDPYPSKDI
ncbi:hypothetical protein CANTEDRAFT_112347 [Yamadazyma tenuis ATCC 10573]|uniref:EamA domain-containing protein n=1 Tax=Candida tenuis (strain ATCC 10573 / BCRC 21748 / CBS 615 / JCM 9827 / NBRC 10315 / NRRL Y-1498 / VKM Y-70) TaxID=590646 RepID=G3AWW7_CANTC|nr:uncharacterized protein CANTEDRAFT_112347 [Yamadazyma tenuis ATCC 10573]EGV66849.1 hypothetical protein CANTEDRAFT_112347 [Yamadazyma tenuis ATCC 10573]